MTKQEFLQKREAIKSEMQGLEGAQYEQKLRELQTLTADFQAETASIEREHLSGVTDHKKQNAELREFLKAGRAGSSFELKRETGVLSTDVSGAFSKHTMAVLDKSFDDQVIFTKAGCPVVKAASGISDWLYAGSVDVSLVGELTAPAASKIDLSEVNAVPNRLSAQVLISNQAVQNANIDLVALITEKINNAYAKSINFAACSTAKYGANFYGGFASAGKQTGEYLKFDLKVAMEMVSKVAEKNYPIEYGCFVMGAADYYALKATPVDNGSGLMVIDAEGKLAGFPVFVSNAINRTTFKGSISGHNIGFGLFNLLPCMQHGNMRLSIDATSASAAKLDAVAVTCNSDWSITPLYQDAFIVYAITGM